MVNDWIEKCRNGDRQAFASVVKAFQQKIFGLCWQYLREDQSARDAAADIFCQAYAHFEQFDSRRSFAPWLLTIATNHLLQIKRREKRRGPQGEWPQTDPSLDGMSPEDELLKVTDSEQLEAALGRIPDRYRLVLHLRYYEDLSYEEIAEMMGAPVNTVGSLVLRAKGLMRKELAHLGR